MSPSLDLYPRARSRPNIDTMAASADLSAMSDDEVQKMLAARTEELRKLKEEVAQQDAAKAKPAKAEAALAQQPAQPSFKDWWPFPIPQRAPSWGIFVLPFYLVFNSWGEMSKLTTAAIILCTCISTCVPAFLSLLARASCSYATAAAR